MTLAALIRSSRATIAVWGGLIALTVASWVLGADTGGRRTGISAAAITVLVIAFVKVRFVGRHFMELRDAPLVMRVVLDAYLVVVATALVVIYVVTG